MELSFGSTVLSFELHESAQMLKKRVADK